METYIGSEYVEQSSYVVRKERCPECARQGKDQTGDNLAIYSDGHSYCYSCGYVTGSNLSDRIRSRSSSTRKLDKQEHRVYLPEDSDTNYPTIALDWIKQYDLNRNDLLSGNVLWSTSASRLIFPVYDGDMGLMAYQGRYFGPPAPEGQKTYPKWYGKGDLKNTFNILGRSSNQIVLVEDIISAIKLSKITMAMPLYGSHIGVERFKRLYSLYKDQVEVCIYLDPDKRSESIVEARRGMLCGLKTRVIYSERDPKEHSYEELKFLSERGE